MMPNEKEMDSGDRPDWKAGIAARENDQMAFMLLEC